jgi:hypothetical protein
MWLVSRAETTLVLKWLTATGPSGARNTCQPNRGTQGKQEEKTADRADARNICKALGTKFGAAIGVSNASQRRA